MTAARRVRAARRTLETVTVARAALWGAAVAVLLDRGLRLPALAWVPVALATSAALLWRGRAAFSARRVALWLEERHPELRYALVTAIDPHVPEPSRTALDAVVAGVPTSRAIRDRALGAVGLAALALGAALLLTAPFARGLVTRAGPLARRIGDAGARLSPLTGTLTPPAYAGRSAERLDDPSTVAGLVGSRVVLEGPGAPDSLAAALGSAPLRVVAAGGRWRVSFTVPDSAVVLALDDRRAHATAHRLIVVAPEADAPPSVRLLLPARDTVVRSAEAVLVLDADLGDDVGLGAARFELIVSSGESEGNFVSKESTLGARDFGGARSGKLHLSATLASLGLAAGGQLAVRAVALDRNDIRGRGRGYSETRIIRVARAGEYDSLSATDLGLPPPAREGIVTLSMLVQKAEQLHAIRARLTSAELHRRAEALAATGEEVEGRLQEVIATQTGQEPGEESHGESEGPAADPRLIEAANALRDGLTELRQARTGAALPPLYRAKRALDAYRLSARYYIRGRVKDVIVNTALARLAGKDTGHAAAAEARAPVVDDARLREAYVAAVRELPISRDRAVERFTMARVEALRASPALAAALGDAVDALRAGRDASGALLRARRLLFGRPAVRDSLAHWSALP